MSPLRGTSSDASVRLNADNLPANSFNPELEIPVGRRTIKYRSFEMLPGLISWTIIALPFLLTYLDETSLLPAIFILLFMISWFYRAVGISFRTWQGYLKMQRAKSNPWTAWNKQLDAVAAAPNATARASVANSSVLRQHQRNMEVYRSDAELQVLRPSDVIHFVIVPMWTEDDQVLAPTIQSLVDADYDPKKMVVVVAYEQRGGAVPKGTAKALVARFGKYFKHMEAICHPAGLPNEVIGKGGNVTWAARHMLGYFEKQSLSPDRVVVTTLDADNRPHPSYFAHLTYSYVLTHDRKYCSYQPLALYTNNIWDVPAPMRVLAVGNSFFTIIQAVRPHLLRNFSSHAQALASLMETNFWSTRTIVEDGHQYWRSYFAFGARYRVVPIYSPIYQDAVLSDTYRRTLKDQFVQVQRWAYGASDIAYIANLGFRRSRHRLVPFLDFFAKFIRLLDTHVSWATASLVLLAAARIPLLFGSDAQKSIVAHQLPIIASYAQTLALIGLFVCIMFSLRMLPPRPAHYRWYKSLLMVFQWLLLPLTSIIYGSFTALNSQTRLILGLYLNRFNLTYKGQRRPSKS